MKHETNEERDRRIFELREAGMKYSTLAIRFSLSYDRIRTIYQLGLAKEAYRSRIRKSFANQELRRRTIVRNLQVCCDALYSQAIAEKGALLREAALKEALGR